MRVTFKTASLKHTANSMGEFLAQDGAFFADAIYDFYPELKGVKPAGIEAALHPIFEEKRDELNRKAAEYQAEWDGKEDRITVAFESVFDVSLGGLFDDCAARVSLNPICPRWLKDKTFDIFYLYSAKGSIECVLHELTHFVWFREWRKLFNDDPAEYEDPHIKWLFSEMAIHPVLRDERLNVFIKGSPRADKPAYEWFYEIEADGRFLTDRLESLYRESDMKNFMFKGYELCKAYEREIKAARI